MIRRLSLLKFMLPVLMSAFLSFTVANAETGIDAQGIIGRWVRPDGGYVLEIKEIGKDGILKAAYFNPRPINVARAELRRDNDIIRILVELRDVNYPGSTYYLQYEQSTDRLIGTYFQAVEKATFQIEFVKAKQGGNLR